MNIKEFMEKHFHEVKILQDAENRFHINLVWKGVDRPFTHGFITDKVKIAARMKRALESGKIFRSCQIVHDFNGKTYVEAPVLILWKTANADLKKFGF